MSKNNILVSFNVKRDVKEDFKELCDWHNISMSGRINELMRLFVKENYKELGDFRNRSKSKWDRSAIEDWRDKLWG